ncbi:MAG: nucleotidyl transferase AbiEii/AbiGii toxin family protein [Planctomycetales bacterium]|nr:nucleotidyl transferase AbiEii/AbiGii toxin family protein [Planctomycetales bacterium]
MTKRPIKNLAASVRQRLTNTAKAESRRFSDVLQYYALERWLFRLSQSPYRDRFILKGALLFVVWKTPATRPTRDIDFLGRLKNDMEYIRSVIADVCLAQVDDDGLRFDPATVATERIAEDADYQGVRATFQARLGNARIPMQIDIGFSDVMTPGPTAVSYPTILDFPAASLLAYNRETAIAEKFEAMVKLGELNSRMKDFFDVATLAANFDFEGQELAAAILATFAQRQTPIQSQPICFSDQFASDPAKATQWKAFVRRSVIVCESEFSKVVEDVRNFLQPVASKLVYDQPFNQHWDHGGSWR